MDVLFLSLSLARARASSYRSVHSITGTLLTSTKRRKRCGKKQNEKSNEEDDLYCHDIPSVVFPQLLQEVITDHIFLQIRLHGHRWMREFVRCLYELVFGNRSMKGYEENFSFPSRCLSYLRKRS